MRLDVDRNDFAFTDEVKKRSVEHRASTVERTGLDDQLRLRLVNDFLFDPKVKGDLLDRRSHPPSVLPGCIPPMEIDQLVKKGDRDRSKDPPKCGVQLEADAMEHFLF